MEDLADFRHIPSEVRLAAGERDPQQPPQGSGNLFDLVKRQFLGPVRFSIGAGQVKAKRASGVAFPGDEEGELERPFLAEN
tara:strand:+ start:7472 stop:7714 length:243 start_codon:yes stop_codon:yes gene_type:complete